ncbi:MAG: DUF1318 domain-containing protein, partial [Holophagae bacterium]|nr:DUF1318 domain-containing protein [Holophagae bacterium]
MKKLVLISICFTVLGSVAFADGNAIKERMRQRLPVIMNLKNQGMVGENNRGFLEYRSSNHPSQQV